MSGLNFKKTGLIIASVFCGLFLLFVFNHPTSQAATGDINLSGYAWSDNVGWISFSGTNYGVVLNNTTKQLVGYAWSDNIGWIKFGGLSGFPTGAGTVSDNAQINSTNHLVGWARACAGSADGQCGTASRTDGWDGWISLGGTNYEISLIHDSKDFDGYAWGSDVIGWIDFSPTGSAGSGDVTLTETFKVPITIDLTASPASVLSGNSSIISWSTTGADTCIITKNGASWATTISGSKSSGSLTSDTTFVAECRNSSNNLVDETIIVTIETPPPPVPSMAVEGETGDIVWDAEEALSCTLQEGVGTPISVEIVGSIPTEEVGIKYTLECTYESNPPQSVFVVSAAPSIGATCTPSQGTSTEMYINRQTTWTVGLTDTGATNLNTQWSGTNIAQTEPLSGLTYNKIYTTVGVKTINATTTGKRSSDGSSFISTCSNSAILKLDTGSGGEI